MKIAILQCVLGNFDKPIDPVKQNIETTFHRFTDLEFPPITGLTPRLQYRIPKLFGWQMLPNFDYYIWLDGSMSFTREDCASWFMEQLGDNDIAFFKHPNRNSIKEEVEHIEDHLKRGKDYITSRYKNGLHREMYEWIKDNGYRDDRLYASTAFIYKNNKKVQGYLTQWWTWQSRYYSVDQIAQTFCLWLSEQKDGLKVKTINEDLFNIPYLSLVSKH